MTKTIITTLCALLILQSCLVSRCLQPKITGYVYDFDSKKPLATCLVNGSPTDSTGYYEFGEVRYREFTFIGFEAPPIDIQLFYQKDGFSSDTFRLRNPYGGAMRKGAHWEMDTLFLKRLN